MKKIIITGGAGFIGSHLAKLLSSKGYRIIIYDDFSNGSGKKNLPKNVEIVKGSILNYNKMKSVFKNSSLVYNLAVLPLTMSFENPERVVKVNDFGTYLVAKLCSDFKIKMIHISSSEAYGTAKYPTMKEDHPLKPTTIYAASKASSESYVQAFGETQNLQYVIVRPFNAYGEFMREDSYGAAMPKFFERINNHKNPIIFGNGNQTRDLTFVSDTVNGIYLASKSKQAVGNIFNIANGKETTIKKIAKIMIRKYSELTGVEVDLDLNFEDERIGDVKRHLGDISYAKKVLHYYPKISLEDGLTRYIKWKLQNTTFKL